MDQKFTNPILTPSTKAEYGKHDEPISREEIVGSLVEESIYKKAAQYALELFSIGQKWDSAQGLILVDTKYEFGIVDDELIVIDEIHTPDSSRYWIEKDYEDRFDKGEKQNMLDKENIRQWLITKGFSGEGEPPKLTNDIRISLSEQYIRLYEILIGKTFHPVIGDVEKRINKNLQDIKVAG